jgi:hypothetical protein
MDGNRYSYAVQKLTTALSILVAHTGDARKRLNVAYLSFHTLQERDFPPPLQKKWRWVMKELTKFGPLLDYEGRPWRGSVGNTTRRIRNSTASKIIKVIYELYWEVSENEQYL